MNMSASEYIIVFALCFAVGISIFCKEVEAGSNSSSEEDSSEESKFKCPTYYGNYPDPEDCGSYYECDCRTPYHRTCPKWMRFDKYSRCCKPQQFAACEEEIKFECPTYYGTYPDTEDCEAYYECQNGNAYHRRCPAWMKFDKHSRCCQQQHLAVCEEEIKFECPDSYGKYPDTNDCEAFYVCEGGYAFHKRCSAWMKFDKHDKLCKPQHIAVCEEATTTSLKEEVTTEEITTTTMATTAEEEGKETTSTLEEKITAEVTATTRPSSTVEEEEKVEVTTTTLKEEETTEVTTTTVEDETKSKEIVTSTERATSEPTGPPETNCEEDDLDCIIKETGEISDWFKCPDYLGFYKYPNSKKLFIFCINNKPFLKSCGQDLIYSEELRTCVKA